MTTNALRMARIVREVTGDVVRITGENTIMAQGGTLSLAARAHLTNNGWVEVDSEREFRIFAHVTA